MRIDRRDALAMLPREIGIREAQTRGGAALKLSTLGALGDESIACVAPAVAKAWTFVAHDDFLYAQEEHATRANVKLFPVALPAAALVRAFDGRTKLGTLASDLAARTGWDAARALAYARGVFLHLVQYGICLPN